MNTALELQNTSNSPKRIFNSGKKPSKNRFVCHCVHITKICPNACQEFDLLRATAVDASCLLFVGWFMTIISTSMFVSSVQSWISTKMFSGVPTRSACGAAITSLRGQIKETLDQQWEGSTWSAVILNDASIIVKRCTWCTHRRASRCTLAYATQTRSETKPQLF